MKCEYCDHKLNPILTRGVGNTDEGIVIELQCPYCGLANYVNLKVYFAIKDDWNMPTISPVNNKLPADLNVVFVSMERCGISWIIRNLNQVHEKMFQKEIIFEPEVSPLLATRERFELPKNWINVYNVDPELLLNRGYDRVVIVHRDLETLLKVYSLYYPPDLAESQRERFIEKTKNDYKKVYEKRPFDKKCFWVNLADLNRYTVKTFNNLMDFLNFPTHSRPIITAIKPPDLRDWEAYSSILEQSHTLVGNLGRIASSYTLRDGLLEYTGGDKKKKEIIELNKILIIGPRILKGCHMSENLFYAFEELGYDVDILPVESLSVNNRLLEQQYKERKMMFPLSKAIRQLEHVPELIIIDEPSWFFLNDVDIPVFYIHREFKRPPKVFYPDIALFWHKGVSEYFKSMFAPYWANKVNIISELPPAVDPKKFKLAKQKTRKGICHLAGREHLDVLKNWKELTAKALILETKRKVDFVKKLGLSYIHNTVDCLTDEQYRDVLPYCGAIWSLQPSTQYISRRMLDAMVCKTVVYLKLENEEHEKVLESMGLNRNEHYIHVNDLQDLKVLHKTFNYNHHLEMVEKAYNVVISNHSFVNRAKILVEFYKDYIRSKKGVIIE